jgi:hypothetical protein
MTHCCQNPPDIFTANVERRTTGPKPSSCIVFAGECRPRMARCTTATAIMVRDVLKSRPNASLADSGTPSQKEYAWVAEPRSSTCDVDSFSVVYRLIYSHRTPVAGQNIPLAEQNTPLSKHKTHILDTDRLECGGTLPA